VAGGALEAGVFFQDGGVGDGGEVGVDDHGAVQGHFDVGADGGDFFMVPLAGGLQEAGFGREDVVNGAVVLGGAELAFIHGGVVVQDLNFHADVGCVAFKGGSDADAVVGAFGVFEIEAEDEVAVFGFGEEVAVRSGRRGEDAVIDDEAGGVFADVFPAFEVLAVEEAGEAWVGRAGDGGEEQECLEHWIGLYKKPRQNARGF